LCESFGLEICPTCYKLRDDVVPKNFMVKKQFFNPQEAIKVGSIEISIHVNSKTPF